MEFFDTESRFKLTIHNYQFTHGKASQEKWDANWLRVYIDITTPMGHWKSYDPCILTWEVQQLFEWLLLIADQKGPDDISFLEPNLAFHFYGATDGIYHIGAKFEQEWKPRWAENDPSYTVYFSIPKEQLLAAADSLREYLAKFPPR